MRSLPCTLLVATLLAPLAAAQNGEIDVAYTAAFNNLANWDNDAALLARAKAVVEKAAFNWQLAFPYIVDNNVTITVTVDWGLPVAYFAETALCGVGGVDTTQVSGGLILPETSTIILSKAALGNPPGSKKGNWFIDPTPAVSEEYTVVPATTWRGKPINKVFHVDVAGKPLPCGISVDRIDMLSWVKHEFGHALGMHYQPATPMFAPYIAEVILEGGDTDPDVDLTDFGGTEIVTGPFANLNLASHWDPMAIVPPIGLPGAALLMAPAFPDETYRTFMSPYDVSGVAHVWNLNVGTGGYVLVPKAPAGVMGGVPATEVMYGSPSGGDEYVEFTNVTDQPVDMTGWSFDDSSNVPGSVDLSGLGVLSPGESGILTTDTAVQFRADWGLPPSVAVVGGNTQTLDATDQVNLYDADDLLAARVSFGGGSIAMNGVAGFPAEASAVGADAIAKWRLSYAFDSQGSTLSVHGDRGSPGQFTDGLGWHNLDGGLAGTAGQPWLEGAGLLVSGQVITLKLVGGPPLAPAFLVVGFTELNAPFKGGTLVPTPNIVISGLPTSGAGGFLLPALWPTGLPGGFELFYQVWLPDAGAPHGLAATNGVSSTTP